MPQKQDDTEFEHYVDAEFVLPTRLPHVGMDLLVYEPLTAPVMTISSPLLTPSMPQYVSRCHCWRFQIEGISHHLIISHWEVRGG